MIYLSKVYIRAEYNCTILINFLTKMFKFYLLCLLFVQIKAETCTLSDLYESDIIKEGIRQTLENIFEVKFEEVIKEAKYFSPYLVNPAYYFQKKIKNLFIEEGRPLENIRDLDIILKYFNYLSIGTFRKDKLEYERSWNG